MVLRTLVLAFLTALSSACASSVERAGIKVFYRAAELPENRIRKDVAYKEGDGADAQKHRLDLFLPPEGTAAGFPAMVFVHGGYWSSGDRTLLVGGKDIYRNIGRFYASRGIATAVISYRLQPRVALPDQLDDVATAVAWVRAHLEENGGDPARLFLAGHSAGGQLVTRLALDRELQQRAGLPGGSVCGVVAIDGAGYDVTDEMTYEIGGTRSIYKSKFGHGTEVWEKYGNTLALITKDPPPPAFLVLLAGREHPSLIRQSQLLQNALHRAGGKVSGALVPRHIHSSMALAMSNPKNLAAKRTLQFIAETPCTKP